MPMTNAVRDDLIKHYFRTGNAAAMAALYVALYTAAPGDTGGGTEVAGGSYARVQRDPLDANWAAASTAGGGRQTSNSAALAYAAPTANWGVVVAFGIHDTAGTDSLKFWELLTVAKTVNNGDAAPSFAIAALTNTFI